MNFMNRYLYVLLLLLCSSVSSAQYRSLEKAEKIARDFMSELSVNKKRLTSVSRNELTGLFECVDGVRVLPYYIFTDSADASFVIVSGDERMSEILAYGNNSSWGGEMPCALNDLLEHYKRQFEALQNDAVNVRSVAHKIEIPNVEPLISSVWDQGAPYNNLCPDKTPSGCVATAMSQIMNYHKYPARGSGHFSYVSNTKNYRLSYDFSSAVFDWDKIKDSYKTFGGNEGRAEVADLTYACGISVGMDYAPNGSGAYMPDIPYALIEFFNYNPNVTYRDRAYYSSEEWYDILCNELKHKRPVVYGGVDQEYGGHAFIIDGCDSIRKVFHVNWGWGGSFNGYFSIDALNPEHYNFASEQSMVVNISPVEVGVHEDTFYADSFTSSPIVLGGNVNFMLTNVYNFSNSSSYAVEYSKFNGYMGIGLYDEDFNYICSLDEEPLDELGTFYGYSEVEFNTEITRSLFGNPGVYKIAPYVIGESSLFPTRVRTRSGTDCIVVAVNDDDIDVEGEDETVLPISFISESFESRSIPENWSQKKVCGTSQWTVKSIIAASSKNQAAADGLSYAVLEYSNDVLSMNRNNAVTKLITNYVNLSTDSAYCIDLMTRARFNKKNSDILLTLYYEYSGEWVRLAQYDVVNDTEWQKISVSIPGCGKTRFAFEGDVPSGGALSLDYISLSVQDAPTGIVDKSAESHIISVHNVTGVEIPLKGSLVETLAGYPKGVYIVRYDDLKVKSYMHY